jgi:alpha/beta superfamily hydrolase
VNFSRLLATRGYAVLRFDYWGQGESEGTYEESTLSTRQADVESAVGLLLKRTNGDHLALMGLRLGGTIACLVAARNHSVNYLILWEPIVDVPAYLSNLLRVNMSMQMVMHKAVMQNRAQLVEEIRGGGAVSINGFRLTREFFQEAMETEREDIFNVSQKRLTVLLPATKYSEDGGGDVCRLEFPAFWKEPKRYCTKPVGLFEETCRWIDQNND